MSAVVIEVVAEAAIRSALLVILVAAILPLLRIRAAAVKHAAWTAVLCAMLLMPALQSVVPAIGIPIWTPVPYPHDSAVDANSRSNVERDLAIDTPAAFDAGQGMRPNTRTAPAAAALPDRQERSASLSRLALGAYVGTTLVLLVRFWFGWRSAGRLARSARPINLDAAIQRFEGARGLRMIGESPSILSPVTIGAIVPVILLPTTRTSWSDEQLRAVLAHEMAHVRRRDPLINLLAHINRCLFWFHPGAWWLERVLTAEAEQACDEAAIRASCAPDVYARFLVEMARGIRDRGGRVAWRGVGIDGNGFLSQRVDHVLRSASWPATSSRRKAAAVLCCAAATILAVACRPSPTARERTTENPTEVRDRKLHRDLEHASIARFASWRLRAADLPPADVLETAVARNPDDLAALRTLLIKYWIEPPPDLSRRRSHILWLIEHRPDEELAGAVEARLFPNELDESFPGDPAGYERAKTLWLARTNTPDVTSRILGNAAAFFEAAETPLAEQLLLRARALDPDGPWTARLGRLYGDALAGAAAPRRPNRSRTFMVGTPRDALGLRIRKTLAESMDEELLTATGWFLARGARGPGIFREFEPDRWAETCFQRALEVNPRAVLARTLLLEIHERMQWSRGEPLWTVPPAQLIDDVAHLPEAERFERLPELARGACRRIDGLARWNDDPLIRDRIELARQQARTFAEDALALAPKYRAHPKYGTAIFLANMTLGRLALNEGDRTAAIRYLRLASRAPVSEELAYSQGMASSYQWHLAADLLKQGEREAVLDFLDRMAVTSVADRFELREAAAEIRRGGTPNL